MSAIVLVVGLGLCLSAALALVLLVLAPPVPRVAAHRRLAPGVEYVSGLTRVTDRTSAMLEHVAARRTRRLFGRDELDQAGIRTGTGGFLVMVGSGASVAALLGVLVGLSKGTSLVWAIVFALLAPVGAKLALIFRTSRRRAKFADQVDDTVQLIAGGLRAGHGLARTVAAVANDADPPMSEELARVVNEARLGRSLAESLVITARRMRSDDLEWVAQAVAINQETGGNLAEVLDQVGKTIRQRNEIRRQVRALSSEGRLSAVVLVSLPIAVFLFLSLVQPGFVSVFFETVVGVIALIVATVLLIVGAVWVAAAVRVKF